MMRRRWRQRRRKMRRWGRGSAMRRRGGAGGEGRSGGRSRGGRRGYNGATITTRKGQDLHNSDGLLDRLVGGNNTGDVQVQVRDQTCGRWGHPPLGAGVV